MVVGVSPLSWRASYPSRRLEYVLQIFLFFVMQVHVLYLGMSLARVPAFMSPMKGIRLLSLTWPCLLFILESLFQQTGGWILLYYVGSRQNSTVVNAI